MLDLPGIIEGAKDGKGRGRQVIAVARTCSLIFIVLDVLKPLQHKRIIERELEGFGIRLNKTPPNIAFKKKDKGGINLAMQVRVPNKGAFNVVSEINFSITQAQQSLHCRSINFKFSPKVVKITILFNVIIKH